MQKGQPRREGKPSLENNREQRVQKEARFVGLHCPPRRKGGSGLQPFSVVRKRVPRPSDPCPGNRIQSESYCFRDDRMPLKSDVRL